MSSNRNIGEDIELLAAEFCSQYLFGSLSEMGKMCGAAFLSTSFETNCKNRSNLGENHQYKFFSVSTSQSLQNLQEDDNL